MPALRIVSDLHLGHPASSIRHAEEFLPLLEGCGKVLLNGDTVESCSAAMAGPSAAQFAVIADWCRRQGVALDLQPGNHDPDQPGPAWRSLDDGRIVVTHGDACFRFGSPWSPWARKLERRLLEVEAAFAAEGRPDTLENRLELARRWSWVFHPRPRHFDGTLGKLETLWTAAWPPYAPLTILRLWAQVPRIVSSWLARYAPDARVAVIGHTHRAGIWHKDGRWVINTGAFHPFGTPRIVDWDPGRLEVRRIVRRGGSFHPGRAVAVLEQAGDRWERATRDGVTCLCASR